MKIRRIALTIGVFLAGHLAVHGSKILIRSETLYTAAGPPIINGEVLVIDSKIAAIGRNLDVSPGTLILKATSITPGLIDIHTHIGNRSGQSARPPSLDYNENSSLVTPECRAIDAFDFYHPDIKQAVAGGVTTAVVRPGSGNVISGVSFAVKMKAATPEGMVLKEVVDLKMSLNAVGALAGQQPDKQNALFMSAARTAFDQAEAYRESWQKYLTEGASKHLPPPARDLGLDHLVMALDRKIPVHIHAGDQTPDGIIELATRYHLRISIAHANLNHRALDAAGRFANYPDI